MARTPLLFLVAFFGAASVGTLLVLGGEGARGPRAVRVAKAPARRNVPAPARIVRPKEQVPAAVAPEQPSEELISTMAGPQGTKQIAAVREMERRLRGGASPVLRERLLGMLATAEPSVRDAIAGLLGGLEGDVQAASALVEAWKGAPDGTRRALLEALFRMNVAEVTPTLLASVGAGGADEPLVIRTVGRLATPADLERLMILLGRPLGAASRTAIEEVLAERGPYDKILPALDKAKLKERRSLLRILASDPKHAAAMRGMLEKRIDPESRGIVIRALGNHGDALSGSVLLGLVQRGSAEDRRRAAQALSSIRNAGTIELLAEDWRSLDGTGRAALLGAMARLPSRSDGMIATAREGLRDGDARVRASAASVLGATGGEESVDDLARLLDRSEGPEVANAALAALDGIGTRKAALAALGRLDRVADEKGRWRERFERILEKS